MNIKQTLPVSYLLFTTRGRIPRGIYWTASVFTWCTFYILYTALSAVSVGATWILYPLLFWIIIATGTKRLHDQGTSGWWLLAVLVPVAGPLWLIYRLGFKRGHKRENRYGSLPGSEVDYFKNGDAATIPHLASGERIVNDVTQLNPVLVSKVVKPASVEELQALIKNTTGTVSVGGGRFSMGGQTASHESMHIDMRGLNKVLYFSKEEKLIKVQAGIRWCDIQHFIDEHDLSIKIMQTYANFTVGGSLNVNSHGRYIGGGPLILSVRSIDMILADGSLVHASKTELAEIFYGAIGGYNGIGIIVQAELELADNVAVKRSHKKMALTDYHSFFFKNIRENKSAVFHNADIYPPQYTKVRAITWAETKEKPNVKTRLMPLRESYPIGRYFIWAFTETPTGKWRREHIVDPLVFAGKKIHWRNYEAGYDVAELEPRSRKDRTYVLQEYFVPVARFDEFCKTMSEIFIRHKVNVINISIRHAGKDAGSYMAWAREEVFAFVVYYKQRTRENAKHRVAVWTRELMDAVTAVNGTYYLPYQAHATSEQFHKAYPGAEKMFALKAKLDPDFRFRNVIWDTYYQKKNEPTMQQASEFKTVFSDTKMSDDFYRFLQVIFHLYPEDRFHDLIRQTCDGQPTDEAIYKTVQNKLPTIKPFLSELSYDLPALKKQKKEIAREMMLLLTDKKSINGYLEIGSTGRYISALKKLIPVTGQIYLTNDIAPSNSIADIFERGQINKLGKFFDLADYEPISSVVIPDESLDVVCCNIGLHHAPLDKLEAYINSINRVLRKGGLFIIRDHDVNSADMAAFVSLVHTVFNLGLKVPWETDQKEFKKFRPVAEWADIISRHGFKDTGNRILQYKDPSLNTLMSFIKQ